MSERRSRRQGALNGMKWGLAVGGALGVLFLATPAPEDEEFSDAELAVSAVLDGALFGALIGALLPGRRWRDLNVADVRDAARVVAVAPSADAAPPPPAAPATVSPRAGRTPVAEIAFGMNGPTTRYAQFPGLLFAAAVNVPWKPTQGAALVAEADLAYLRYAVMAGPRVYFRSAPLFSGRPSATYFGQFVAGRVRGEQSGVVRSVGGVVYQPGIGIDYGRGFVAGRLQIDYSAVPGSYVDDERVPDRHVETLTHMRVAVSLVLRSPTR